MDACEMERLCHGWQSSGFFFSFVSFFFFTQKKERKRLGMDACVMEAFLFTLCILFVSFFIPYGHRFFFFLFIPPPLQNMDVLYGQTT